MAYRNNYDDLLRDIQASGQSWSTYDLDLAKGNPDAGRSIYTQKLAYANAQTDAERQAANDAAEMIRRQYGGYTGGKTGAGFTLTGKNTANQTAPSYTQYASKYQPQIDDLMAQLSGRPAFSYKPTDDPSYAAFSEHYRNAGNQAREDTLAQAAAMVGGQPSTYAVAAAEQAQNAYNAQMSDIIPQLKEAAYGMYVDEGNAMRDDLSLLMAMDEAAYNRHQNEYANQMAEWEANYGASRDAIEDARYDQEWELALRQAAAKAAGGGGPVADEGEETIDLKVALAMAEKGVFTDEVLKAFYAAGFTDEYLKREYGYEPDVRKPDRTLPLDAYVNQSDIVGDRTGRMYNIGGPYEEETEVGGKPLDEYDAAASNYSEVASECERIYKAQGKQAVLEALKSAHQTGVLNTGDYMALTNKYRDKA
jgi:hypothetical protein